MKFDPEYQLRRQRLAQARNPGELAYLNGLFDGIDHARTQVAWIVVVLTILAIVFHWI